MLCGIKFCGGCNPRYDRLAAAGELKSRFAGEASFEFVNEKEEIKYDLLLVIGGCSSCCASHGQYETKNGVVKLWDETGIDGVYSDIKNIIDNGG